MRASDTWVCVADEARARFFRCDPGCDPEPVMGFGLGCAAGDFPERVAGQLDRAAAMHLYEHLVLVGPGKVITMVDEALGIEARNTVVGQVHRSFSTVTPGELVSHLNEWLPH